VWFQAALGWDAVVVEPAQCYLMCFGDELFVASFRQPEIGYLVFRLKPLQNLKHHKK